MISTKNNHSEQSSLQLETEKDLLLMLVATLKKQPRKKINSLTLLSNKILSADKDQLKTLDKEVHSLFKSQDL